MRSDAEKRDERAYPLRHWDQRKKVHNNTPNNKHINNNMHTVAKINNEDYKCLLCKHLLEIYFCSL